MRQRRLQHAVGPRRQPPEEVERNRGHLVAEPGVPQDVQACEEDHDTEWSDVEDDGSDEAEGHKQRGGPRISPAQQRLQPLSLCREVTNNGLDPPSDAPQPVVPHPHDVRWARGRESVKLFIKLIRVGSFCM
uniref:Uncharacterized protein n=1 Tax=Arundo donax TaxID=35708 RepID=A0A0A9FSV5_ARUDO